MKAMNNFAMKDCAHIVGKPQNEYKWYKGWWLYMSKYKDTLIWIMSELLKNDISRQYN